MSRLHLRRGDIALLGRLNRAPLEIGHIPAETLTRLTALGLVKTVLGCCEITRAGQLTYQRHQFQKVSGGRVARVTRRHPLFLHETRFRGPANRTTLMDCIRRRRTSDAPWFVPGWLVRLTSGRRGIAGKAEV